ncbi:LuxR C-terminal-related transcriptional regulator [Shinella sp. BYT-45]|uniref:LuxR C-terminal-related transcriptional regulator n=1 Tax=Shinella sp. BYT-45 TaxID=3377377 RepID=UPI003980A66D
MASRGRKPAVPLAAQPARAPDPVLLIEGGCAKTISRALAISPGTVRNHIKTVYRKLGVHSQVELMAAARDGGLSCPSLA